MRRRLQDARACPGVRLNCPKERLRRLRGAQGAPRARCGRRYRPSARARRGCPRAARSRASRPLCDGAPDGASVVASLTQGSSRSCRRAPRTGEVFVTIRWTCAFRPAARRSPERQSSSGGDPARPRARRRPRDRRGGPRARRAEPADAGRRRRLPARHDEDPRAPGAELGVRERPRRTRLRAAASGAVGLGRGRRGRRARRSASSRCTRPGSTTRSRTAPTTAT